MPLPCVPEGEIGSLASASTERAQSAAPGTRFASAWDGAGARPELPGGGGLRLDSAPNEPGGVAAGQGHADDPSSARPRPVTNHRDGRCGSDGSGRLRVVHPLGCRRVAPDHPASNTANSTSARRARSSEL